MSSYKDWAVISRPREYALGRWAVTGPFYYKRDAEQWAKETFDPKTMEYTIVPCLPEPDKYLYSRRTR